MAVLNDDGLIKPPWLSAIRFTRLRFYFQALSGGEVNWFLGPEIRGSIGHQIKLLMGCLGNRNEDCRVCPDEKKEGCVFEKFFFKENKPNKRIGLILQIEPAFRGLKSNFVPGETLRFDLILIGNNKEYGPHFIKALKTYPLLLGENSISFKLRETGLVDNRGHFSSLAGLSELPEYSLPTAKRISRKNSQPKRDRLEIHFLTPMELFYKYKCGDQGKKRLYIRSLQELTFRLIIERLIRRTYEQAVSYCDCKETSSDGEETNILLNLSEKIQTMEELSKVVWTKVPIRNNSSRFSGGLQGKIVFKGDFAPFQALLTSAGYLGLGFNVTSGFGQISWRFL